MRVTEVLRRKGGSVVTIAPDRTVRELLGLLAEHLLCAPLSSGDGVRAPRVLRELALAPTRPPQGPRACDPYRAQAPRPAPPGWPWHAPSVHIATMVNFGPGEAGSGTGPP